MDEDQVDLASFRRQWQLELDNVGRETTPSVDELQNRLDNVNLDEHL